MPHQLRRQLPGRVGSEWRKPAPIGAGFVAARTANLFEVILELAAAGGVAELAERLGLDLADPFAGDVELLADFLEGPRAPVLEAEAQLEHPSLAACQRVQNALHLLLQELVRSGL